MLRLPYDMISAVVLTKNEEKNIAECLKSLTWCDEVIVVDDYSKDDTRAKCQNSDVKCQVFQRHLSDDFAAQRNFGLEKARGEWVLFVDADERISPALASEIQHTTNNIQQREDGFYLKRRDFIWGKELKHGEVGNVRLLRLAKKGVGKWKKRVHEVWDVKGKTSMLENPILHYPHQTLREFVAEVESYSTLHAKTHLEEGRRSSVLKIVFYPIFKFLDNWGLKFGFLDGTPGFLVAKMMSFHSFLAWSKLWLMQKNGKSS